MSCGSWILHPVDPLDRSSGKISHTPVVMVRLGQAQQICLPEGAEAVPVDIFVTLRNLPAHTILISINDTIVLPPLFGTEVAVHLAKVGIGHHKAEVQVEGQKPVVVEWAVYQCPPRDRGELYKPDGSGLKDYCNCPGKEELCQP